MTIRIPTQTPTLKISPIAWQLLKKNISIVIKIGTIFRRIIDHQKEILNAFPIFLNKDTLEVNWNSTAGIILTY